MRAVLIFAAAFVAGCASIEENWQAWDDSDARWQWAVTGATMADGYTTSKIEDYPCIVERPGITREVLGKNPGDEALAWFAGVSLGNYAIARALPPGRPRRIWQGFATVFHGGWAVHNANLMRGGC